MKLLFVFVLGFGLSATVWGHSRGDKRKHLLPQYEITHKRRGVERAGASPEKGQSLFKLEAKDYKTLAEVISSKKLFLHYIEANSEQRQPQYLGASPLQMQLGASVSEKANIPEIYKSIAEEQSETLRRLLGFNEVELEGWPIMNDYGRATWAFARYRKPGESWHWFDNELIKKLQDSIDPDTGKILPTLPFTWRPAVSKDFAIIFGDVLEFKDLYQKPRFSDCVWTTDDETGMIFGGWQPSARLQKEEEYLQNRSANDRKRIVCRDIPQPPRLDADAISFILRSERRKSLVWPRGISWKKIVTVDDVAPLRSAPFHRKLDSEWPAEWRESYQEEVHMFSGEKPMPVGNSVVTTEKRNSIQKDNDLLDIVRYLETQYKGLGIKTLRQEFLWRGIKQVNLIAKVKGSLPPSQNKPVLIADHYDTAFEEDTFEKTKVRQASRGANDNYVATSGLLTAARYFQGAKPKHDIWFVHLTGEEFPGDDLGARIFVRDLLKDKQDVSAVLLMDMIGYNPKNRKDFQINSGLSRESMRVALLASELVSKANLNLKPLVLHRYEPKSYLYNTDGIIFDEAGFPIVFFNEVMNRYVYDRKGYHDTHDRVSLVNFDYAFEIVKLVTLTADALAHR